MTHTPVLPIFRFSMKKLQIKYVLLFFFAIILVLNALADGKIEVKLPGKGFIAIEYRSTATGCLNLSLFRIPGWEKYKNSPKQMEFQSAAPRLLGGPCTPGDVANAWDALLKLLKEAITKGKLSPDELFQVQEFFEQAAREVSKVGK